MINELRSKIRESLVNIERIKSIEEIVKGLENDIVELERREQQLWDILQKENEDVERLERMSATTIFYSIFNQKEAKLDKEQEEAYRAKLNYDSILHQLEEANRRLQKLLEEKTELLPYQKQYQELFQQLRTALKGQAEYANELMELEERYGEVTNQIKEIQEALYVSDEVIDKLVEIEKELSSASGWGTWDMLGGGMISSIAKHSHLDSAQRKVENLESSLYQLKNELADVQRVDQIGVVNMDGFIRFADYFFDGFFVDWMVLSKIEKSSNQVKEVRRQIEVIIDELSSLSNQYQVEKNELRKKITDFIINT